MAKYGHPIFLIPADRPRLSRFIAFLAGAATTLAFAPFGWSLLAPLLLLPLLYVCLTVAPRDAAGHTFWYGFGLFLTGTYWIYISVHVFGNAALWIAIVLMVGLALIMAFFLSLAGWLISRVSQGEPWLLVFVAPASWVLIEWLRGWALTGFPWMAFGYGQIDTAFAGWAPVLGVYGVSFMLVLSAAAAIAAVEAQQAGRLAECAQHVAQSFRGVHPAGGEPRVALDDIRRDQRVLEVEGDDLSLRVEHLLAQPGHAVRRRRRPEDLDAGDGLRGDLGTPSCSSA